MTRFMLVICLGFFAGSVWAEQTREDFVVHEADGPGVFRLTDARGKYVALHFLLKTTCPHCLGHTVEYTRRAKETPEVVHVFLKPDTEEEIRKWSVKLDKKWAQQMGDAVTDLSIIYRDPDAELAKLFEIPNGYKFHGQVVHYPALVLLEPDGKEVFRYVGKNNGDRYAFDDLVAKIAERKGAKP
ncbi:MAG: redoxin domain-containing protein [bacterium]|nr:redoxin domain-containing protein [bacterium]